MTNKHAKQLKQLVEAASSRPRPAGNVGRKWYSISANAGGDSAEVMVYDEIGFWGTTAKDFVRELKAIDASTINLHLNSPGGDVFDGVAIYNALRQHSAKKVVHVDGLAASAASVIAMAGDEIRMPAGAYLMIHNPWSIVLGGSEDFRKEAALLDKISGSMAEIYAEKSGGDAAHFRQLMAEETWLTGPEAVDLGLADEVTEQEPAQAAFDLTVFARVPDQLRMSAALKTTNKRGSNMADENKTEETQDKPAQEPAKTEEAPKTEAAVEEPKKDDAPVTEPAKTEPAAAKVEAPKASADPREEFRQFTKLFGDKAGDYFSKGLSLDAAKSEHLTFLADENKTLKTKLSTIDRGAQEPASASLRDETSPTKGKGLESVISVKGK